MTTRQALRCGFVVIAALVTMLPGITPALAEPPVEVLLTVKTPEPAAKNKAPQIEATIIGGPILPLEQFTLVEPGVKVPRMVKAASLRPFSLKTDTMAVAVVFNGQEVWVGNDDYEPEDSSARYLGILKDLKTALQGAPFAMAGPGSKGVLITYADRAEVRLAMGPLSNLTAERFGTQRDYNKKFGTAMLDGIRLALAELRKVSASRKALIVIGDGNDSDPEAAKALLAELKTLAVQQKVQTFAITFKGQLSESNDGITTMIPDATSVKDAKDIEEALESIVSRMADRYYVTFPGHDPETKQGLVWDGESHDLVVRIDQYESDPVPLTLSPQWNPPTNCGFPWSLAMVGGAVVLLSVGFGLGRRR